MESHSILTRIRKSARAFKHKTRGFTDFEFTYEDSKLILKITTRDGKKHILDTKNKAIFYRKLRYMVMKNHMDILSSDDYKHHGQAFRSVQQCPESNKFNQYGMGITFSGYKFIHRARLGLHVLNGNTYKKKDGQAKTPDEKRCRRCNYEVENLNHVLCHCFTAHSQDITMRHDSIINRLVTLIPHDKNTELHVNKGTKSGNNLRPDIMKIDHNLKRACIIDITCPFEKDTNALQMAAKRKVQKYSNEAAILRKQGYRVYVGGFVIGALWLLVCRKYSYTKCDWNPKKVPQATNHHSSWRSN